jgi:phospholipid/cholesterol/gamma-HCH transport system permease protein
MAATNLIRAGRRSADRSLDRFAELGSFGVFSAKVLYHALVDVVLRLKFRRTVIMHMSDIVAGAGAFVIGGGMVFVVAAMALAVGATVGVQAFAGLSQIGAESFVGLVGSYANTREITPLIAAVALSAQVGSAFTAEIGAMRISDEIDALEVMSIPSLTYLVCTRLVAMIVALIPLYLVAMFTSFAGTKLVNTQLFGMSPGQYDYYFNLYLPPIDIVFSLIKVLVFATELSLIHGYYGYYANGGPVGVGRAVGIAIRTSIIVIVITNLLLSYLFWGGEPTVSLTG